jgi:hypothetical protein
MLRAPCAPASTLALGSARESRHPIDVPLEEGQVPASKRSAGCALSSRSRAGIASCDGICGCWYMYCGCSRSSHGRRTVIRVRQPAVERLGLMSRTVLHDLAHSAMMGSSRASSGMT